MPAEHEVNFDGLVGPTHSYAGLSAGNVASMSHGGDVSRPRLAALQGLAKMRALMELGLLQGVLPPQERPLVPVLRRAGFSGSDREVIARAAQVSPSLLAATYSASSMWAANAATVAPSADTADRRVHFTPANLVSTFHRSLEPDQTARALERIFPDPMRFVHHAPLPAHARFGDEGAANHTRLVSERGAVHLFVYGRGMPGEAAPARFPARQTREASEAVARLHGLDPERTLFARQAPEAIDAGAFHNDVVSVGHRQVFFCHEQAFADADQVFTALGERLGEELVVIQIAKDHVSLERAVKSYLFNSQLVSLPDASLALIAPRECEEDDMVRGLLDELVADPECPLSWVRFFDLRESMKNGGGPACLRLRVALTDTELASVHRPCLLGPEQLTKLEHWVTRHYREELRPADLGDAALLEESRAALDELTGLLALGSDFYPFQRV